MQPTTRDPHDPFLAFLSEAALAAWVVFGLFGGLWVSDDFDAERHAAILYAAIPLTAAYYALHLLRPTWPKMWPRFHLTMIVALALIHLGGGLPLVNALTTEDAPVKRTVLADRHVAVKDVRRGGLGLLYRTRW